MTHLRWLHSSNCNGSAISIGRLAGCVLLVFISGRLRFECLNLRLFAVHSKLNFSLQSFAATPTPCLVFV